MGRQLSRNTFPSLPACLPACAAIDNLRTSNTEAEAKKYMHHANSLSLARSQVSMPQICTKSRCCSPPLKLYTMLCRLVCSPQGLEGIKCDFALHRSLICLAPQKLTGPSANLP